MPLRMWSQRCRDRYSAFAGRRRGDQSALLCSDPSTWLSSSCSGYGFIPLSPMVNNAPEHMVNRQCAGTNRCANYSMDVQLRQVGPALALGRGGGKKRSRGVPCNRWVALTQRLDQLKHISIRIFEKGDPYGRAIRREVFRRAVEGDLFCAELSIGCVQIRYLEGQMVPAL